jgi:hypothetical protein
MNELLKRGKIHYLENMVMRIMQIGRRQNEHGQKNLMKKRMLMQPNVQRPSLDIQKKKDVLSTLKSLVPPLKNTVWHVQLTKLFI